MQYSIFIRSYRKDFRWLNACLFSITKYAQNNPEVILCIPDEDINEFKVSKQITFNGEVKLWTPIHKNGYIDQQINKLYADEYVTNENILFVDSDCFFIEHFSWDDYSVNGVPRILKTSYEILGDAVPWKRITEKFLKQHNIEFEFMRRIPTPYLKSSLPKLRGYIESIYKKAFKDVCKNTDELSEFNAMGAFAYTHCHEDYKWLNTEKELLPKLNCIQYWSWGGPTPAYEQLIKEHGFEKN